MPVPKLVATNQDADVQLTSFSIDGLARYVCNTWEEATQHGPFDFIVIGSGMYGAYAASKLYELSNTFPVGKRRPKILVLESGPFLITEHVQNLTRVGSLSARVAKPLVDGNQSNIPFVPHHRCVGGKSLFWGGWAPRLTDDDLDRWPKEVADYMRLTGEQDGYEYIEGEIGTSETTDFISGTLYDNLKARAEQVQGQVAGLTRVAEPPIAVQGSAPASGLFSYDKFSSLPLLMDAVREDSGEGAKPDSQRRLFLVPHVDVLKLRTTNGVVDQIIVALKNPVEPAAQARVRYLDLAPHAQVVIAGNTINSTRLALNSFPRPASQGDELMGRNFMFHVRGNLFWRVKRLALNLPADEELQTAAFHVEGHTDVLAEAKRRGRYHFQFYAAANADPGASPGAFTPVARNPEAFLYRLLPNLEDVDAMLDAQDPQAVAIGIRTIGETFGDRNSPVATNNNVSWMNVNPFGGGGDDVYFDDNGTEIRVPKAYVHLVERAADHKVRDAQRAASFQLVAAMAGAPVSEAGNRNEDEFNNSPGRKVVYIGNPATEEDGNGTTYHECGTLWMGERPDESVTDVNGRFHHVANACCVDQALFPTSGSANPVPTGLTVCRKVVRGLLARFDSPPPQSAPGFDELFGGTLSGWEAAGANNFFPFTAGGTAILGAGVESTAPALGVLLRTTRKYRDFELRLDWKAFSMSANSGIFVRAPAASEPLDVPNGFYDLATEIQIDERGFDVASGDYGSPLHKTGAVYEKLPARQWAARRVSPRNSGDGFWNRFEITVQGNHIRVVLNGKVVSEGDVPMLPEGFIGLQCHTEVVQFRNIRLKAL